MLCQENKNMSVGQNHRAHKFIFYREMHNASFQHILNDAFWTLLCTLFVRLKLSREYSVNEYKRHKWNIIFSNFYINETFSSINNDFITVELKICCAYLILTF